MQLALLGEPPTNHIRRPWGPLAALLLLSLPSLSSPPASWLLSPPSAPGFSLLGPVGPYCPRLLRVRSRSIRQRACPWGLVFRSVRARLGPARSTWQFIVVRRAHSGISNVSEVCNRNPSMQASSIFGTRRELELPRPHGPLCCRCPPPLSCDQTEMRAHSRVLSYLLR